MHPHFFVLFLSHILVKFSEHSIFYAGPDFTLQYHNCRCPVSLQPAPHHRQHTLQRLTIIICYQMLSTFPSADIHITLISHLHPSSLRFFYLELCLRSTPFRLKTSYVSFGVNFKRISSKLSLIDVQITEGRTLHCLLLYINLRWHTVLYMMSSAN